MFKLFKEKLKNVLKKLSTSVENQKLDTALDETSRKKKEVKPLKKKDIHKEEAAPLLKVPILEETKTPSLSSPQEDQTKPKKGFFKRVTERITTTRITAEQFDSFFNELELTLLENNVALLVVDHIREQLKHDLIGIPLKRGKILDIITHSLHQSVEQLFIHSFDLIKTIRATSHRPYVVVFVGVNGSGKTTTIAKVASLLKKNNLTCVLVAGDTWRAASIQQLEEHAQRLDVKVIKHTYGSDPAAVAFDGIKAARANNIDVVLIDTAGRQHSNKNLMEEMKKIIRVAQPDLKIFIGESITGNDSITQSEAFNAAIGIDGIILTKSDIDEKGGAIVSISYVTKKPILYLGLGQDYSDLETFDPKKIMQRLGL